MAKITLNIEASDSTDLADTISSLMYLSAYKSEPPITNETDDGFERMNAGATQDAEPGERQARKRRTKAEMAADAAAQTAPASTAASSASASQPSQPKPSADVFGDQLKEVAAEAKTGALSLADVEKVGREAFEKIGAPAMQAILMDKANGAKSFKQVEPQFFEAVHAALVEAAGE